METRPTRMSRTGFLYFIPLVLILLGFVFMAISNSQPYVPGGLSSPIDDFFWSGALILIAIGILGGIISFGLFLWRSGSRMDVVPAFATSRNRTPSTRGAGHSAGRTGADR